MNNRSVYRYRIMSAKTKPLQCIGCVDVDHIESTLLFSQSGTVEESQDICILAMAGRLPLIPSAGGNLVVQHPLLGNIVLKRDFVWVYKGGEHWRIIGVYLDENQESDESDERSKGGHPTQSPT